MQGWAIFTGVYCLTVEHGCYGLLQSGFIVQSLKKGKGFSSDMILGIIQQQACCLNTEFIKTIRIGGKQGADGLPGQAALMCYKGFPGRAIGEV